MKTVRTFRLLLGSFSGVLVAGLMAASSVCAFEQAALFVTSAPSGATVVLDDQVVGQTPLTLTGLAEGEHTIVIEKQGYEPLTRQVQTPVGELTSVGVNLASIQGSMTLITDVVGAEIVLDGRPVGKVTADRTEYPQDGLGAGGHTLVLRADGVEVKRQFSVSVPPQPLLITVRRQEVAGSVEITSDFAVSAVLFDGVSVPQALPAVLDPVSVGAHQVVFRTQTLPVVRQVVVRPGEQVQVHLSEQEMGKLIVTSDPPGLQVWVDGMALAAATPAILERIPAGEHRVDVLRPGEGQEYAGKRVGVEAQKTSLVTFTQADIVTNAVQCPPDMVYIPAGSAEGVFWEPAAPAAGAVLAGGVMGGMPGVGMMAPGKMAPGMMGGMMGPMMPGMSGAMGAPGMFPAGGAEGGAMGGMMGTMAAAAPPPGLERTRTISLGFCIDKYEYPNRPGVLPELASFYEAAQKCREQGKRLCLAEEWVRVCRGPENFKYPYGGNFDPNACNTLGNTAAHGLAASGSFPTCVSGYGVFDMSGNAEEWVYAYAEYPAPRNLPSTEGWLVVNTRDYGKTDRRPDIWQRSPLDARGGSWLTSEGDSSCAAISLHRDYRDRRFYSDVKRGFRCCLSP